MVVKKKSYAAYRLTRNKETYSPPLEEQLNTIFAQFERRFGSAPAAFFVGPVVDEHGQVLVKENEVWIEIMPRERAFTTAY